MYCTAAVVCACLHAERVLARMVLGKSPIAYADEIRALLHSAATRREDLGYMSAALGALATATYSTLVGVRRGAGHPAVDLRATVKRQRNQVCWQRREMRRVQAALQATRLGNQTAPHT